MVTETQFIDHLEFLLNHLIHGEIKRGKSFGVHFYQNEIHLIEEITKPRNEVGVWEAKIKTKHPKTNNWIEKKKASTFFPTAWDKEILILKLEEAFLTQQKISGYHYVGQTSCGVTISFFYRKHMLIGCFPIYHVQI